MTLSRLPFSAIALALVALPGAVQAQTVSSSKLGFPIGEKSRIHAHLATGIVFDSNPDRFSSDREFKDWRYTVRPGLAIDVPGENFLLKLSGQFALDYYFGTTQGGGDARYGGDVGLETRIGSKKSHLSFEAKDHLTRTPTFFPDVGSVGAAERRFQQWYNVAQADIIGRPGGKALELRLGYRNQLNFYDALPASQRHGVAFETKWKFFPKTAVLFNFDMSFFSAAASVAGLPETLQSSPYNITLGLRGQLTQRITAEANVGFGDSLVWQDGYFSTAVDQNIRTVVAAANIGWAFLPEANVTVGYDRRIVPVIQLNSYTVDSFYLSARLPVGTRLNFGGLAKYELRNFLEGSDTGVLSGDVRAQYWFFDWLEASLIYQVLGQLTVAQPGVAPGQLLLEEFVRQQVMLTVGFHY